MDGLSAAASILQLAQMAGKTALEVHDFFSVIRNAPQEITTISRDIHAFYTLIHNLESSLSSDTVFNIVNGDAEVSKALWTLERPIENCRLAFNSVKDKIRPHLKADTSTSSSGSGSGSGSPTQGQRMRISRADMLWYFKRKDVFALAAELERAKATFSNAMGSVTLLLTLKTSLAFTGGNYPKGKHEFSDDLGSALATYAESMFDHQSDDKSSASRGSSIVPTTQADTKPSNPEAAEGLKTAVFNDSVFLLKAVLQHVHVDARDRKGRTALSHAAEHGKVEIAKLLLEEGASVSARQWSVSGWAEGRHPYWESGATPLYYAARSRQTEIVNMLLQHGANPDVRTTAGDRPLQVASENDGIEIVRLLLSKKVNVNARNYKDGWSPLHGAVVSGNLEIIQVLLDHGALPDIPLTQPESKTPLHFAVEKQNLDCVQLLLKHNADPNALMLEHVTPLHLAAAGGWVAGIELLASTDAFLDARDMLLHESPIHKAARNLEKNAMEKLIELGANKEARNVDGQTCQEILECAMADPDEWKVDKHLAIYISKDMWWSR